MKKSFILIVLLIIISILGVYQIVEEKVDKGYNQQFLDKRNISLCSKSCQRPVVNGYRCERICQEDGGYRERSCQGDICVEKSFNEGGELNSKRTCVLSGNTCNTKVESFYDKHGKKTSTRTCSVYRADGKCTKYGESVDYAYDDRGNKILERYCNNSSMGADCNYADSIGREYMYDIHGNLTSERYCTSYGVDGKCIIYSYVIDYIYDRNGHQLSGRYCYNNSIGNNGNCRSYYGGYEYTYDSKGNQTSWRNCEQYGSDGYCIRYSTGGYDYTYDTKGHQTSRHRCLFYGSDGKCAHEIGTKYTYDTNGNQILARDYIGFGSTENYGGVYTYKYDANGNQISYYYYQYYDFGDKYTREGAEYTYDEEGNKTSSRYCDHYRADLTCTNWHSTTYY